MTSPSARGARRARPRGGAGGPATARSRRRWLAPLAAALAGLALYLPAVGGGFVWDDHLLVEQNPLLRSWPGLARALTADFWVASGGAGASGLWRPLVSFSYALEGALSGWDPRLFHLVNAAAHGAVSGLVAVLALGAGLPALAAALAGLAFATLPAHVESVAWISGRTDVLCALFFLLALWLDRRARAAGRAGPGAGALVALGLALLSKETALPFLLVVAVAEWTDAPVEPAPRRPGRARWLLPYALLTLAYLVAHQVWVPGAAAPAPVVPRAQLLPALALMFPGYLAFVWPWFPHTPAVTLEPARAAGWMVPAAVAAQALFVLGVAWLARRRHAAALPLALFWLTLLPTLAVDAVRGYALYAERFLYLPSAGLAWAAAAGLAVLRRGPARWAGSAVLAALVAAGAAVSLDLLPDWRDDAALFESMARRAPRNYMARTQWARRLAHDGREAEARRELDAARALDPARPEVPAIEALLAARRGDWATALDGADTAIARGSVEHDPRLLRVAALLSLGRAGEGRRELEELRRRLPGQPAVESLWGQYLVSAGRSVEAYPVLARAAALLPADGALAWALALAANDTGRHGEARAVLERLLAREPARREAWAELARTCDALGDAAGAAAAVARLRAPDAAPPR